MRCEKHQCKLKYDCKLYLMQSKYKLIIQNPNLKECEHHQPHVKITKSA